MVSLHRPLVLSVVAMQAEQLPVAAVARIIHVVVVFVMHREFTQTLVGELTALLCALDASYGIFGSLADVLINTIAR